jgi:hypothetical protein
MSGPHVEGMLKAIRHMMTRSSSIKLAALVRASAVGIAAAALTACGSSGTDAASDTDKFLGHWTYQPGSMVTITCAGQPPRTQDLGNPPPGGTAANFTMTLESMGIIHEIDDAHCSYEWDVESDVASLPPGQSCSTIPDGRGGKTTNTVVSATKTTSDGETMTIKISGNVGAPGKTCPLTINGTAKKM